MTILALYSNKGGVGKTAAAVNLAYLAAQSGLQTLICDLDAQGSTTFYLRVKPQLKKKARGLEQSNDALLRSIKASDYDGLDLLPSDFSHRNLDISFDGLKRRKHRLNVVLEPLQDEYELIVLDCPPTINILAENIFSVSDVLLTPMLPTTLSVRSYEQLCEFMAESKQALPCPTVFFSMVDGRKKLHHEIMESFAQEHGCVLQSVIPYLSQVEQMGITREPVPAFAPHSRAADAYQALWDEVQTKLLRPSVDAANPA